MSVVIDAVGTEQSVTLTQGGSGNYTGLTVVSNTNGAIVLVFTMQSNVDTLSTVTGYTFVAAINAAANDARVEIWAKVGNSTGAQTVVLHPAATWSGTDATTVAAISVTGADQTGGTTTFAHSVTANGTTANPSTGNVTTATSDLACAVLGTQGSITANGQNHTLIFNDNAPNPSSAAQYEQGGTSPTTFTWTAGAGDWAAAAVDIVAAGGSVGFDMGSRNVSIGA